MVVLLPKPKEEEFKAFDYSKVNADAFKANATKSVDTGYNPFIIQPQKSSRKHGNEVEKQLASQKRFHAKPKSSTFT